jgi:hypothetical protein
MLFTFAACALGPVARQLLERPELIEIRDALVQIWPQCTVSGNMPLDAICEFIGPELLTPDDELHDATSLGQRDSQHHETEVNRKKQASKRAKPDSRPEQAGTCQFPTGITASSNGRYRLRLSVNNIDGKSNRKKLGYFEDLQSAIIARTNYFKEQVMSQPATKKAKTRTPLTLLPDQDALAPHDRADHDCMEIVMETTDLPEPATNVEKAEARTHSKDH